MKNALLVPIHLDALYLQTDRLVVEAMADFSKLPYVDRNLKREINADNANISEEIVSQPFQSQNLYLKAGVHLHWALPDALTKGVQHADKTEFPAVPNRWLVTRHAPGGRSQKSWIVESDYVFLPAKEDGRDYTLGAGARSGSISYFYREVDKASDEPFRFVGRQVPLELWLQEKETKGDHFATERPLTALGYGDIAFAAFYPNCHSVFGFHDGEGLNDARGYEYEVVGWYADENQDRLKSLFLQEAIWNCFKIDTTGQDQLQQSAKRRTMRRLHRAIHQSKRHELSPIVDEIIRGGAVRRELRDFLSRQPSTFLELGLKFFKDQKQPAPKKLRDFKWTISDDSSSGLPERMLFYSKLSIDSLADVNRQDSSTRNLSTRDAAKASDSDAPSVTIAVGNTTMEALSAYVAHQLAADFGIHPGVKDYSQRMERLEDQLESLYLSNKLSNRRLDIGPKFREARHDTGFRPVSGGIRWKVRIQTKAAASGSTSKANGIESFQAASARDAQTQRRLDLPPEIVTQLSKLNQLQGSYDDAQQEVSTRRWQLFSDWYKYMLSTYHPADAIRGDDYPDVDKLRFFIKEKDIAPLEHKLHACDLLGSQTTTAEKELSNLIVRHNHSQLFHIKPGETPTEEPCVNPDWDKQGNNKPAVEGLNSLSCKAGNSTTGRATHELEACLSFHDGKSHAKITWQKHPGLTVSAWVHPLLDKNDGALTVFAMGQLNLQLKPRFVITKQTLKELHDHGADHTVLGAIANTIEQVGDATDRAAFLTANDMFRAIKKPAAIRDDAWEKDQAFLRTAAARLDIGCAGIDDRVGVIPADRWHHVALTYEESSDQCPRPRLAVYIDGRRFPLPLSASYTSGPFNSILVGADENGGHLFRGKMTHVRVDSRALLAAEVRRDMNNGARPVFQLQKTAAPRYWEPTEPVVLIVGDGIRATERHGQDGRFGKDDTLECPVVDSIPEKLIAESQKRSSTPTSAQDVADEIVHFSEAVQVKLESTSSRHIALNRWTEQPWNPLMLEWEVLLQPAKGKTNVDGAAFAGDVITTNYDLKDNAVDLTVKPNRQELAGGTLYSNSCFLTPHAGVQMRERIAEFLQHHLERLEAEVEEFKEQKKEQEHPSANGERINNARDRFLYGEALETWFEDARLKPMYDGNKALVITKVSLQSLRDWYHDKPLYAKPSDKFRDLREEQKVDDPVYVVICAGRKLFHKDGEPRTFLTQALGGFNDELLMDKHTMQLPVEDPLGFDDYRAFTQQVADLLDGKLFSAPEPTNQFNPIRSGAMSITRLRLIDSFGQVKDFNNERILAASQEIITPQRLTVPASPHMIWMPPRLVQPARVDFHWLPSQDDDSAATPICGWVLPNNLQKSLAIYDEHGKALGSILQRGNSIQWEPAPGRNRQVDEIANSHLREMVEHILAKGDSDTDDTATDENFLTDFLTTIESALETIDPEGHAQHLSMALLMGRPIAVVRASLNLQLQGAPAVHQGWHAFRADIDRTIRESDNFTRVRFPVRIGEYQQLNDGVVGYWKEARDGYELDKFYAPQTPDNALNRSIDHPDIVIHDKHWIEKRVFTETFGERGDAIWKELLHCGWLKSLGDGFSVAQIIAEQQRNEIHLGVLAPHAGPIKELLKTRTTNPLNILQTIDSPPQYLTMLFDPRGKVHLTSGFLPTKVIDIPAEDYAQALEAIEVTFLTAPILTERGTRSVAVPDEPGFDWSWLEHKRWLDKQVFVESLTAQDSNGKISQSADKVWERLHECGWIKIEDANHRTRLVPMGRRKSEQFDVIEKKVFKERLAELLEPALDDTQVEAVWNHLVESKVRWLKRPLKVADGEPTLHEIVPKKRRCSQHLTSESLAGMDPGNVADKVEQLFDSYIDEELSDAWKIFGKVDRGESISSLEDHIERLFWAEYASAPVMERETFVHRLQLLAMYELRMLSVSDERMIPETGKSLVVMAKLNERFQCRIFDSQRKRIVTRTSERVYDPSAFAFFNVNGSHKTWPPTNVSPGDKLTILNSLSSILCHPLSQISEQRCGELWNYSLAPQVRWLVPITGDPARGQVVTKDARRAEVLKQSDVLDQPEFTELSEAWLPELQDWIERILVTEALELSPMEPRATFPDVQEIREGYLVFSRQNEEQVVVQQLSLNLTLEEINLILEALGERPCKQVFPLVKKIQAQSQAQLQARDGLDRQDKSEADQKDS